MLKINLFGKGDGSGLFCDKIMSKQRWYKWVMIGAVSMAVFSCGDKPTCLDIETNLAKISFVDVSGNPKDITLSSLKAIHNEDGFPEYADSTLNKLFLSLNPGDTISTFIIEQANSTDTLGLSYSVKAVLISPECGFDAAFDQLDTTFTTFKNLQILQRSIHEDIEVNIEVTL